MPWFDDFLQSRGIVGDPPPKRPKRAAADGTYVAPPQLPELPTIGPLQPQNMAAGGGIDRSRDAYQPLPVEDQGVLGSGEGQSLFDVLPGVGSARGVKAAADVAKQSLPLGLLMGGLSVLPEGGALAGKVGKALGKELPFLGKPMAAIRVHVPGEAEPRLFTGAIHPTARLDAEDQLGDLLDDNFEPRFQIDEGFVVGPDQTWLSRQEGLDYAKRHKLLNGNPRTQEAIKRSKQLKAEGLKGDDGYTAADSLATRSLAGLLGKDHNPDVLNVVRGLVRNDPMPRVSAIDPDRAAHMAKVYEGLPKSDPNARSAYDALNREVSDQLKAINDAGYKIEYVSEDPYANSAEMMKDVRENKRLKVFKTPDDSFHPYMTPEQNDAFRAVHDWIAHAGPGNQFGPVGEENAYRMHAATLSPEAQRALATETRGQNSWVNFGPNAHLPVKERPFAEQKAALWPQDLLGDYDGMQPEKIVSPAITVKGKTYHGFNHGDAYEKALGEGMKPLDYTSEADGFVTNHGRFVSRKEAADIARAQKQLRRPEDFANGGNTTLNAEDLPFSLRNAAAPARDVMPAPAIISRDKWTPTERGVFDRKAPELQGTAEPDPRMFASMPRGKASDLAQAISESPVVEGGLLDDALEGLPRGGREWYELGPLWQYFEENKGPFTFADWLHASGAGSVQNPTHNELATASGLLFAKKRGIDWEMVKQIQQQMHPKEKNLWLGEDIEKIFKNASDAGILLPESPSASTRKVPWYTQGKFGGSRRSLPALDTHERRRITQLAAQDPNIRRLLEVLQVRDKKAPNGLRPFRMEGTNADVIPIRNALDYEALAQPYMRGANLLDLPSSQAFQAGRWLGGGEHTGLLSAPYGDYIQTLEDGLLYTARLRGLDESPAGLRRLANSIFSGDEMFAPVYSRKGGFPGVTGH